jgi:hypothetical protein
VPARRYRARKRQIEITTQLAMQLEYTNNIEITRRRKNDVQLGFVLEQQIGATPQG